MARKPNYNFERMERQRAKAAKKAARQEAKKEKAEKRKAENADPELAGDDNAPAEDGNSDLSVWLRVSVLLLAWTGDGLRPKCRQYWYYQSCG